MLALFQGGTYMYTECTIIMRNCWRLQSKNLNCMYNIGRDQRYRYTCSCGLETQNSKKCCKCKKSKLEYICILFSQPLSLEEMIARREAEKKAQEKVCYCI